MEVYREVDAAEASGSAMQSFLRYCETHAQRTFEDYTELQAWATSDSPKFWQLFARWSQLAFSGSDHPPIDGVDCEFANFFPNLKLNYARCLLRSRRSGSDDLTSVIGIFEGGARVELTRRELREAVECCAAGLLNIGVEAGDRVVAIACNTPAAIVACLATAAIGATWSSAAPDIGKVAVLARFKQLDPVVLFINTEYTFHGTTFLLHEHIASLAQELPTLRTVVALDSGAAPATLRAGIDFTSLDQLALAHRFGIENWTDFPFNQPLFILFSSGTTGPPKCLLHGAGGTLIEHYKEQVLHSSFVPNDRLYFQTSVGWMMWNWQLSALACGAQIVLFDGSPTFPKPDALLKMIDRELVTVFGTSATYLHMLQQLSVSPQRIGSFPRLHTIQSTGSILFDVQYDWIAAQFGHVKLQSISGGTDLIGCLVLGNPLLPTYRGESQCISLGLDVQVMTNEGLSRWGEGELVCVNAFPSRPIGIVGDTDGSRFHETYFMQNPGIWTHGDRVRLYDRGSARILGRSDGTLNVRGIRVGPAEIYGIVLAIPGVLSAMAIEQRASREPGGSRLVLLVVLREGVALDRGLTLRIKRELRKKGSPNHVPAIIVHVAALPMTHSGKFSERAVSDLLNGKDVANRDALRNPESLEAIASQLGAID